MVQFLVRQRGADVAEFGQQRSAVHRPVLRICRRAPLNQFIKVLGQAGSSVRGASHHRIDVLVRNLDGGVALVGLLAGQHFVEHDAGRVNVAAGICGLAEHQFGSQISHGADQGAGAGVGRDRPGQAEVTHFDAAVVGYQDVLGLDVTMDQSGAVGGGQSFDDRIDQGQGKARWQGACSVRTSRRV